MTEEKILLCISQIEDKTKVECSVGSEADKTALAAALQEVFFRDPELLEWIMIVLEDRWKDEEVNEAFEKNITTIPDFNSLLKEK